MARFFEFEKKFGWAELISLLALIVASAAFLQSRSELRGAMPNIVIAEETPSVGVFYDQRRGQWRLFTYNRLLITNLGGRTATLVGLRPSEELPWVIPVRAGKIEQDVTIPVSIFPTSELCEDLASDPSRLEQYEDAGLERLSVLNQPIEPGETGVLNLGIIFAAYSGRERLAETVLFGVDLVFGDGTSHPYRHGYPILPIP